MAKYITAFETINDYNVSKEGLDYPNISLIKSDGQIEWVTETPPTPLNVITYEATEKLAETRNMYSSGLHTNVFSGTSSQQLTITSHTFENGVGTIEFNGDIARIGDYAFYYCSGLTSVTIPNSVTNIGNQAFYYCRGLTNIVIPNGVTNISRDAFAECTGLTSVTVNATTPPTLGANAFNSTHINLVIYVPSESVEAYKSATNWSNYASRIQAIS